MYITELGLSTRTTNVLTRAWINTVEKLLSVIEDGKLTNVRSISKEDIREIMRSVYCRNCKRSIYGEYKDCDINIENDGQYVKGITKCGCKVPFEIN